VPVLEDKTQSACFCFIFQMPIPNTVHSTLNRNSNKPQTQTSAFIPNSQTANCPVGTWMCLAIAMNAQEPRPPCVQRRMFLRQDAFGKSPVPMIDDGERQPPPEPKTLAVYLQRDRGHDHDHTTWQPIKALEAKHLPLSNRPR
jgi:hypothetical protein